MKRPPESRERHLQSKMSEKELSIFWKDLIIGSEKLASDSSMSPSSVTPMKSEISEVLEAITMMGQNLQRVLTAPQRAPHLGTQDFPYQLPDQASFTANLL